jgi:hypothetical protein
VLPGESLTPFGPGHPVQVTSSGDPVTVWVARPSASGERPYDHEFEKVGRTPVTFQLPTGTWLIEVEGVETTRGDLLLEVRSEPVRLLVRTGSEGLGTTGTLLMAVGIAAALGGAVVLVGGSQSSEGQFDDPKIYVPLFIAGGVLIGTGIGLFVASRTNLEQQKTHGARAHREWLGGLSLRF